MLVCSQYLTKVKFGHSFLFLSRLVINYLRNITPYVLVELLVPIRFCLLISIVLLWFGQKKGRTAMNNGGKHCFLSKDGLKVEQLSNTCKIVTGTGLCRAVTGPFVFNTTTWHCQ